LAPFTVNVLNAASALAAFTFGGSRLSARASETHDTFIQQTIARHAIACRQVRKILMAPPELASSQPSNRDRTTPLR